MAIFTVCVVAKDVLPTLHLLARQSAIVSKVGESYVWKMVKYVTSHSQRTLREGCVIHLFSSKRHFSRPLLLKKWSMLVLKVGVSNGWRSI